MVDSLWLIVYGSWFTSLPPPGSSPRVEAMQLGDCVQEVALISRLTGGSRVFLTAEESQRFVKEWVEPQRTRLQLPDSSVVVVVVVVVDLLHLTVITAIVVFGLMDCCCVVRCSTLNCEVVAELLSRQLRESSHTGQMVASSSFQAGCFSSVLPAARGVVTLALFPPVLQRALCAVACLLTSDLLSLERIFGVTQRRLSELSGGPPGPVTNKATKVGAAVASVHTLTPRANTTRSHHTLTPHANTTR